MDLLSLSDDLLLDIMQLVSLPPPSYMGPTRQRNGLLPLMRCSRRLYRLGEPILYRKLVVKSSKTLRRFIKTILAHPDLADHVRVVSLTDGGIPLDEISPPHLSDTSHRHGLVISRQGSDTGPGRAPPLPKPRHFNHEELETIEGIILSLSPDKASAWVKGVSYGSWVSLAALALCLLPNVEDLQIEKCRDLQWQSLGPTRNLLSYPFPFTCSRSSKLRHLGISYDNRLCKDGLLAIPIDILALPSLRTFSGDMMRATSWNNTTLDTKFFITSLHLDRCNFTTQALENLLDSCPDLKFLKYEHDEERQEHPFHPIQFDAALVNLKGCLEELVLYRTALEPGPEVTTAQFGIIKLLKEFEKLTRLSITAHLLLGPQNMEGSMWYEAAKQFSASAQRQSLYSCLPPSLEHLKLKNCGVDIFDQVTGLIETMQMATPNLKSVIIEFQHIRSHSWGRPFVERAWGNQLRLGAGSKVVTDLDELCKGKGVVLDVWFN